MTNNRRRVLTLFLPFLSIGFTLIVLEVMVRVFEVPPARMDPLNWKRFQLSSNPILQYEHAPNTQDTLSKINEHGFADNKSYEKRKPAGVFRIVVVGDSVTAFSGGTGLNWTEVLEENLNKELGGAPSVEIINMAVGGYDSFQQAEFLRVYGMSWDPNLVLVGFCFNDHYYMRTGGQFRLLKARKNNAVAAQETKDGSRTLLSYVLEYSHLAFVTHYYLQLAMEPGDRKLKLPAHYEGRIPSDIGLEMIRDETGKHGVDYLIIMFPYLRDVWLSEVHESEAMLKTTLARLNMSSKLINLREPFYKAIQERVPEVKLAWGDGVHLTREGHALTAKVLQQKILNLIIP